MITAPFPAWPRGLMAALDRLTIASSRPPRSTRAGPVQSRELGRALEFADFRAYAPGDDPRLVDWRAYARLDRLYLKQYREERARTVTLLVDASASLDFGTADEHKGRYARQLAAALAWITVGRLEQAAVFVLQGTSSTALRSPMGRAGMNDLFHGLGDVHEAGQTSLGVAVRAALAQVRGQGPVFLLSDLLDDDWQPAVHAIAAHGQGGAVLQVLAPDEWDPPLGDEVELQDSETGELRQTRFGPSERADYRRRLAAFLAEISATCRRHGLGHVPLSTGTSLSHTLLKRLPADGILR